MGWRGPGRERQIAGARVEGGLGVGPSQAGQDFSPANPAHLREGMRMAFFHPAPPTDCREKVEMRAQHAQQRREAQTVVAALEASYAEAVQEAASIYQLAQVCVPGCM